MSGVQEEAELLTTKYPKYAEPEKTSLTQSPACLASWEGREVREGFRPGDPQREVISARLAQISRSLFHVVSVFRGSLSKALDKLSVKIHCSIMRVDSVLFVLEQVAFW